MQTLYAVAVYVIPCYSLLGDKSVLALIGWIYHLAVRAERIGSCRDKTVGLRACQGYGGVAG